LPITATVYRRGAENGGDVARSEEETEAGDATVAITSARSLGSQRHTARFIFSQSDIKAADTDLHGVAERGEANDLNRLAWGKSHLR